MNLFELKNVSKKYGKKVALNNINLTIKPNRIIGLLGPNGSGKTTLIKIMMGLLQADEGEVLFTGVNRNYQANDYISFLPDCNYLNEQMTINEMISLFSGIYSNFNKEKALNLIATFNLPLKKRFKHFSKGEKEKIQLSLVMSRDAKLYILDEPIAGVDPAARDLILKTILNNYNKDASILISTHLIRDIENIIDDVIFLKCGDIVLNRNADDIREEKKMSIDELFREEFKC